jgi:hypothetical protein
MITFLASLSSSQQYDEAPFLDDFCFLFRPFDLLAIRAFQCFDYDRI